MLSGVSIRTRETAGRSLTAAPGLATGAPRNGSSAPAHGQHVRPVEGAAAVPAREAVDEAEQVPRRRERARGDPPGLLRDLEDAQGDHVGEIAPPGVLLELDARLVVGGGGEGPEGEAVGVGSVHGRILSQVYIVPPCPRGSISGVIARCAVSSPAPSSRSSGGT